MAKSLGNKDTELTFDMIAKIEPGERNEGMAWSTWKILIPNPKFCKISWGFSPCNLNSLQCFSKTNVRWNGLISVHFDYPPGSHPVRNCPLWGGDQLCFPAETAGKC